MAGPGDAHALAVQLLEHCVEALDTIPDFEPQLVGAPDRSFIAPGQPVWDCCEQLAVHVQQAQDAALGSAGTSGLRPNFGKINHVTLVATITRCIPTGAEKRGGGYTIPTTEALQATAEQINADGWALWNHIYNLIRAGEFLTLCTEVFFDGLVAVVPAGGCAGWTVVVRARLDGYDEVLGS